MFKFWLKREARKRFKPLPITTAEKWSNRLNAVYFLSAWSALGLIAYSVKQSKAKGVEPSKISSTQYYVNLLGATDVTVVKVGSSGIRVSAYDHEADRKLEEENERKSNMEFYGDSAKPSNRTS